MKKTPQKNKTGKWFSKYIRLKYCNSLGRVTCYTCGVEKHGKEIQAGHGIGGRSGNILFAEEIVRPQCYGCNVCQSGKLDDFGEKLRLEIGNRYSEILKLKYEPKVGSIEELKKMEQEYKQKAEELAEQKGIIL